MVHRFPFRNLQETPLSYATPDMPAFKSVLIQAIELLSGRGKLERIYRELPQHIPDSLNFAELCLDNMGISQQYNRSRLTELPSTGGIIIIANHPYGILDGLAVCAIAQKLRPTYKILINSALCFDGRFDKHLLPIDFSGTREGNRLSIESRKQAIQTVRNGDALVIFPAGAISTSTTLFGPVADQVWHPITAKIIEQSQATVLPIYFHGHNSRLFQIASHLHPDLRLALIIHECARRLHSPLKYQIGTPLPYDHLQAFPNRATLMAYLRDVTYGLQHS